MPKPMIAEKPYPTTEGIVPDAYSLRIISPSYASSTGELNAILQYVYHSFFFRKSNKNDIADALVSIAEAEMFHLDLLGRTVLALGASPVYCRYPATCFDYYNTKYVAYSRTLRYMLEDDLLAEKQAVSQYEKEIARLRDGKVREIVSRIKEDEELHIAAIENILNNFKG